VPRWSFPLAVGLALVTFVGCSSSSSSQSARTTGTYDQPATPNPSVSAKMVCEAEVQAEIASSLGEQPTQVTTPTWVQADHLYSCRYVYPEGSFALSVKEMSSTAETTAYYNGLGTQFGRRPDRIALGQGAFLTTNGSLVVRKNWKVMFVDVSQVPAQFGQPPQAPSDVALSIAAVIMTCWKGA
jgi:hypothetical protein